MDAYGVKFGGLASSLGLVCPSPAEVTICEVGW